MAEATADIQRVVRELVERLERAGSLRVERVVLFGSYARGRPRRGSDIDLLVLSPGFGRMSLWKRIRLVAQVKGECDRRLEVLTCTPAEWKGAGPASFLEHIKRTGVVVYEAR
ncbi:hypothetical protein HRbin23_00819 [bacterium HR23]|nr:hypothetical protein HRbin23_00819 [bacterium HR23]